VFVDIDLAFVVVVDIVLTFEVVDIDLALVDLTFEVVDIDLALVDLTLEVVDIDLAFGVVADFDLL